jgi:hypothetical protein
VLVGKETHYPTRGGPRLVVDPKTGRVTAADRETKSLGNVGKP